MNQIDSSTQSSGNETDNSTGNIISGDQTVNININMTDNRMNHEEIPDPICCVRFTIFILFVIFVYLVLFVISAILCSVENKCSLFGILF